MSAQRPTPAAIRPWPFGIGVLGVLMDTPTDRVREERLRLALDAYELGLFLLDTFTVTPREPATTYAAIHRLAIRADAQALVIHGDVHTERLTEIATTTHMRIHDLQPRNDALLALRHRSRS
jgi:hypothetical protein